MDAGRRSVIIIIGDIYGHLNMSLVRSVARAIMGKENVRIG